MSSVDESCRNPPLHHVLHVPHNIVTSWLTRAGITLVVPYLPVCAYPGSFSHASHVMKSTIQSHSSCVVPVDTHTFLHSFCSSTHIRPDSRSDAKTAPCWRFSSYGLLRRVVGWVAADTSAVCRAFEMWTTAYPRIQYNIPDDHLNLQPDSTHTRQQSTDYISCRYRTGVWKCPIQVQHRSAAFSWQMSNALLWAVSRTARGKITISGIPNGLIFFVVFIVYTQLTNVGCGPHSTSCRAAGCRPMVHGREFEM